MLELDIYLILRSKIKVTVCPHLKGKIHVQPIILFSKNDQTWFIYWSLQEKKNPLKLIRQGLKFFIFYLQLLHTCIYSLLLIFSHKKYQAKVTSKSEYY